MNGYHTAQDSFLALCLSRAQLVLKGSLVAVIVNVIITRKELAMYRQRIRIRTVLSLLARGLKPAAAAPPHLLAVVEMCILSWHPTKLRRHVAWATSGRSLQIMGSVHWIAERLSDTCQLARTFFIH